MTKLFVLLDAMLANTRDGHLFPGLHTIYWNSADTPDRFLPLFLHDGVKSLAVPLEDRSAMSPQYLTTFVTEIFTRAPSLEELHLRGEGSRLLGLEEDLCLLIKSLPALRTLALPFYFLSSRVVKELSGLTHLTGIIFSHKMNLSMCAGNIQDATELRPALQPGSFRALQDLELCASLEDTTALLAHAHFPSETLQWLLLRTTKLETPAAVHRFFTTVSQTCTSLTSLTADLSPPPHSTPAQIRVQASLSFDAIRGVLALHTLRAFSVYHRHPLNITDAEVVSLVQGLPALRQLALCDQVLPRAHGAPPPLSLRVLAALAHVRPELESLALCMAAAAYLVHVPDREARAFAALEYLQVGASDISARAAPAVAGFLGAVLAPRTLLLWAESGSYMDDPPLAVDRRLPYAWQMVHTAVRRMREGGTTGRGVEV